MKVAIMQPYFAPYLGYISLIKHSDLFILLDEVQFIRHGWIERNRVLKQNGDWLYIQVPLIKDSRETLIQDTRINNSIPWKNKIFSQLITYKKSAPYYYKVVKLLSEVFQDEYDSITVLNKALLEKITDYLGFPKVLPIFSEMNLEIKQPNLPDEWALNICKALEKDIVYLNPINGMSFFDRDKYLKNAIPIHFQKMTIDSYDQKRDFFEPNLSILDVMMFNSPDEINAMLDKFELI